MALQAGGAACVVKPALKIAPLFAFLLVFPGFE
jgi:hypothetical protein